MREFRFRSWNKLVNEMRDNVDLYVMTKELCRLELNPIKPTVLFIPINQPHIELMQYTGLNDKNGIEIYEGDIVKQCFEFQNSDGYFDGYQLGEVVVIASKGACMKNPLMYSTDNGDVIKTKQYKNIVSYRSEVIGNIYENPTLIEDMKQGWDYDC